MRIWVIGALGMLGSAVSRQLENSGIAFIATDKKEVNISEIDQIETFLQKFPCDVIINCAAYTKVDLAEKEPNAAHLVNVKGPENIGKVSKKCGIKPIHFSTDYIFSGDAKIPYLETDAPNPLNTYGKTKYEGEQALLQENPSSLVIRTSWLFGLNGNNFISKMLTLMQEKKEIRVVCNQIGRPTFCEDLAAAALSLLPHAGVFHYANTESASWYDLTKCLFEEAKTMGFEIMCRSIIPVEIAPFPTLAKRPLYSVLDTRKYESILGPARPWKAALRVYLQKYFQTLCG